MKSDNEFRRLFLEHQECEGRLEELEKDEEQTDAFEAQAKTIKLHKLALKDRMENLIRGHEAAP